MGFLGISSPWKDRRCWVMLSFRVKPFSPVRWHSGKGQSTRILSLSLPTLGRWTVLQWRLKSCFVVNAWLHFLPLTPLQNIRRAGPSLKHVWGPLRAYQRGVQGLTPGVLTPAQNYKNSTSTGTPHSHRPRRLRSHRHHRWRFCLRRRFRPHLGRWGHSCCRPHFHHRHQ